MIDPNNITNYDQSIYELEEFLLFWVFAAGKSARTAARALDGVLNEVLGKNKSPFRSLVSNKRKLPLLLKKHGMGCYNQKSRTICELLDSKLNLQTCDVDELEQIYGIGMKTSRCFLIHSRPNSNVAGIDTHILKYLRSEGVEAKGTVPGSKKQYLRLEKEFLSRVPKNMSVAEFDLSIWKSYASQNK